MAPKVPTTTRQRVSDSDWKPRNCVWELTLACNLSCLHCGSRAGAVRPDELTTDECLGVVAQLADQGCELVTLSGGEPTLRKDWDLIARAISGRGIYVNMVTNGVYRNEDAATEIARRALDAGMCNLAVSIDGPREVHDRIRTVGSFTRAMASIGRFVAEGIPVSVLTTVSKLNIERLGEVRELVMESGSTQWRLQLAKPMGSMDDHRDYVLDPPQLLELIPQLARFKKQGGVNLRVGDSIGYYGPHDKVLRGTGWRGGRKECWQGCQAGMQAVGIEADGGVKGCLSLQAQWGDRDPFIEGNLRDNTLDEIWHRPGVFAFNRDFEVASLTGSCGACRHGKLCRGGASCVSSSFGHVLTENPYCYHQLAMEQGAPWRISLGKGAVAAAVLAMSVGATACTTEEDPDPEPEPDVGTEDTAGLDVGEDTAVTEDGGTDARVDTGADCSAVCCDCEYGVIPDDVWNACCAPDPCANVCCDCDYGDPPPPECCE